ncbi:hypothetical protein D3C77_556750 [compost metagenome]
MDNFMFIRFYCFLRFYVDIAADLMVISLVLFLVTIVDRLVYKKITSYVIMNRLENTAHESTGTIAESSPTRTYIIIQQNSN